MTDFVLRRCERAYVYSVRHNVYIDWTPGPWLALRMSRRELREVLRRLPAEERGRLVAVSWVKAIAQANTDRRFWLRGKIVQLQKELTKGTEI